MPRPVSNPPNPWASSHFEWLDEPPTVAVEVYEESARSILSSNDSPDVPFTWSVNPYRGCEHACAYCYARTTHEYLGFGAGTDFDSKIVVKSNAVELLERELARPKWKGEPIAFSGVTDCYQPLEASYELTRRLLEVCERREQPFGVITKSALVRRDAELLARASRRGLASVYLSIPFVDHAHARAIEPRVGTPATRFETLRRLADAGVDVGVAIAPVIPGLNDAAIPEILSRAREAGARRAFMILLRLARGVREVFEERLRAALPARADKVLNALRDARGGRTNHTAFGERMVGRGERWELIRGLFEVHSRRLGYERSALAETPPPKRPHASQRGLFDGDTVHLT